MDPEQKAKKLKFPKKKNIQPSKFMKYKNKQRKSSLEEIDSIIQSGSEVDSPKRQPK